VADQVVEAYGPEPKVLAEAMLISIVGKPHYDKTGATLLFLAEALLVFQKNSTGSIPTPPHPEKIVRRRWPPVTGGKTPLE